MEKRSAGGDSEPYGTIELVFTFMTASTDERVVSLTRTKVVRGSARDRTLIDYTFQVTGTDAGNVLGLMNVDFLLKTVDFLLKTVDFLLKILDNS